MALFGVVNILLVLVVFRAFGEGKMSFPNYVGMIGVHGARGY